MISNHIDALTALVLSGCAILGAKFSLAATTLLSQVSGVQMPDWVAVIVGPLGALAALAYGLKWMTGKLEKSELRAEKREEARNAKLEQVERRADEREAEYKEFIRVLQDRHTERLEKHNEKLEVLTHASIKITAKAANSIDAICKELRNHPCGKDFPEEPNNDEQP